MSTATLAETARYLDGPGVHAWLRQNGVSNTKYLSQTHERRLNAWKNGGKADVYTLDAILVAIGRHLSEVPDELYVGGQRG